MAQIQLNLKKSLFVPKFYPLLLDYSNRWEVYMGSAGSAKSYFITQKLIIRACREKIKILVCRRTASTIRNTCFSLFNDNWVLFFSYTKNSTSSWYMGFISPFISKMENKEPYGLNLMGDSYPSSNQPKGTILSGYSGVASQVSSSYFNASYSNGVITMGANSYQISSNAILLYSNGEGGGSDADASAWSAEEERDFIQATTDIYIGKISKWPKNITMIGNYALYKKTTLLFPQELPETITSIGQYAFAETDNRVRFTKLPKNITTISQYAFYRCWYLELTELPDAMQTIQAYCFAYCESMPLTKLPSNLQQIYNNAFYGCKQLAVTKLPETLYEIGSNAFFNCPKLAITEIPAGMKTIGMGAFSNCSGLTQLTFKGKPDSINTWAFEYCNNLTDIYVPWAEGEVSGAPWSAKNATIHYNHTEG